MIIGVPKEAFPGERRVALVPAALAALTKAGFAVRIEAGAGAEAGFRDDDYQRAGATIALAALCTGSCTTLLGAALFRPTRAQLARVWLFAALSGLCVAELTAALNFWLVAGLVGGSFLLLYFYVTAGLIQALLDGSLDSRLVVEYGLVGLIGLILIVSTTPWRF